MKNGIKTAILPFLALFMFVSLQAQKTDAAKWGQNFLQNEKLKKFGKIIRGEKINQTKIVDDDKNSSPLANGEIVVSKNSSIESEVFASINPNDSNNIIISPIGQNNSLNCPVYYTTNFGTSWNKSSFTNSSKIGNTMTMGGGDPVIAYDLNGKAYLSWIDLALKYTYDTIYNTMSWGYTSDGGNTWNRENNEYIAFTSSQLAAGPAYGLTEFFDKQWMAVDHSNSQYKNTLYTILVRMGYEDISNATYEIRVYKKLSGSNAFESQYVVINQETYELAQFSNIDVDSKGYVHVLFYGYKDSQNGLYYAVSKDGGATFSHEVKITSFNFPLAMTGDQSEPTVDGLLQSRFYPCPQLAVDKSNSNSNGAIYVTWTANGISSQASTGYDIYMSKSVDGGTTWTSPKIVNDDKTTTDQFYSNITVSPEGVLGIAYYDRRNDVDNNIQTDYYVSYSFDGGNNFVSVKVTSSASDFNYIGSGNNGFAIGEYNSLLSTKGYIMPVWADGRTNNGSIKIYFAKVPIVKDPSGVEELSAVDADFKLYEPAPNPANSRFALHFSLSVPNNVKIGLFDIKGNLVKMLVDNKFGIGDFVQNVDLSNIAQGTYLLKMNSGKEQAIRKIAVVK